MAHSWSAFFGRMVSSGLITDFIGQGTFSDGDSVVAVALVVSFSGVVVGSSVVVVGFSVLVVSSAVQGVSTNVPPDQE